MRAIVASDASVDGMLDDMVDATVHSMRSTCSFCYNSRVIEVGRIVNFYNKMLELII